MNFNNQSDLFTVGNFFAEKLENISLISKLNLFHLKYKVAALLLLTFFVHQTILIFLFSHLKIEKDFGQNKYF